MGPSGFVLLVPWLGYEPQGPKWALVRHASALAPGLAAPLEVAAALRAVGGPVVWAGTARANRTLGVWLWALDLAVTAPGSYELEANITNGTALVATLREPVVVGPRRFSAQILRKLHANLQQSLRKHCASRARPLTTR